MTLRDYGRRLFDRYHLLQDICSRLKRRARHWKSGALLLCTLFLSACGGPAETVLTGVFIDSPVEGLHYETPTQSGTTNNLGEYHYLAGETVTFSIGGIVLGSTPAGPVVTPLSLVAEATSANHPQVINIVRLLLSLDSDGDPDNGVTIASQVATAVAEVTVDFTVADLPTDPGIISLLSSFPSITLVTAAAAYTHFSQTLATLAASTWDSLQWGSSQWRSVSQ